MEKVFNLIWRKARDKTLLCKESAYNLFQLCTKTMSLDGQVSEVGVYKGGSAIILSDILKGSQKCLYLFDTFTGMPESDPGKDVYKEGYFGDTSLLQVSKFFFGMPNVKIHSGFFPDSSIAVDSINFCFVHIDVDIHKSVNDCCEFFYPRLASGGILLFDDYGFIKTPGAKIAVDVFFKDKPETIQIMPTGQALIVRQ